MTDKIVTPRRKIKRPVLTRCVFVSAILALLALAILVPTIQGKTLASYFLDLMDETRTLKLTTIRPSIASPHTPSPFTPTSTEITASATPPSATPSPAFTITSSTQVSCIPANPPAFARVLEIVDGNTVKVLLNDLVYVVRYIGLDVPQDDLNARKAFLNNSELVFRKEVILIADSRDKDANGRLLRYVLVGDTFVNRQLLQDGWGKAVDMPPNSSCTETFQFAEEFAIQSAQGMWATVPTSTP